jgi:Tfp pilus assembly protein FimT
MVNRMHRRSRRGWTVVGIVILLLLVAIVAGIVLANIDFERYRMDENARALKNQFIAQQLRAVKSNTPMMVAILYDRGKLRITQDANGNGIADAGEHTFMWGLVNDAKFVIPPVTIGGAAPAYATGPGLTYLNQSYRYPTVTFYPSGSTGGDVVVYIGSAAGRLADLRALQITGASSKVKFYRFASGAWKLADM